MSLRRNTWWNLGGGLFPLLAAAAFIPYCLRQLGNEAFGVLSLVWAMIGYFSLFDLGASRALTYDLCKLRTEGNTGEIGATLKAGLLLTFITGSLGAAAIWSIAPELAHNWLKISPPWQKDAQTAFQIAALGAIPASVTSGLRGALEGMERFAASNVSKIFLGLSMFLLPALSIQWHGASLTHIAAYLALARVLIMGMNLLQIGRYFATGKSGTTHQAGVLGRMRNLVSYGLWLTLSAIVSPLMVFGDRFFVSALVEVDQLAVYTIPQEGLIRMLIIPTAICGALLPVFTIARGATALSASYRKHYRRLAYIMLVLCTGSALLLYPVMRLWISAPFAENALPIALILNLGIWLNSIALMPYTLLLSRAKTKITAQFHLLELGVYIVVLYLLAKHYGLIGAACAWSIRIALDLLLLHIAAERLLTHQDEHIE